MSHQWNNTWSYLSDEVPGRHCQIYVKITAITWWPHVITVWWLMYSYCHVVIVTWLQSEDWRTVIVTWSSSRDYNSGDWCTGREKVHCNDSTLYPERELSVTWNRDMEKLRCNVGYFGNGVRCNATLLYHHVMAVSYRHVMTVWWLAYSYRHVMIFTWFHSFVNAYNCVIDVLTCKYRFVL